MKSFLIPFLLTTFTLAFGQQSEACKKLCNSCPADTSLFDQYEEAPENTAQPLCNRIESNCGCYAYARNEWLKTKAQEEPSQSLSNPEVSQDTVAETATEEPDSAETIPQEIKEEAIPPQDSVMVDSTANSPEKNEEPGPIIQVEQTAKTSPKTYFSLARDPSRITALGFNLLGGEMIERGFPGYNHSAHGDGFNLGLGGFYRYYFYRWGSIQAGANIIYEFINNNGLDYNNPTINYNDSYYSEYVRIDSDIDYHNISLEFPVNLRLGIGINKIIGGFASGTFAIRKPFYEWESVSSEIKVNFNGFHDYEDKEESYSDFFPADAWEFHFYFGFGLEIKEHFSVQFQWLAWNQATGYGHSFYHELFNDNSSWRITADFSF
ncbi:MAG: PorT family protein [Fibrobacter sp.]|nr:PorT family protein [Fibrobacter sp.]